MRFWRKLPFISIVLSSVWTNSVLGQGKTWSVYQYDDLDAVYIQTRQAELKSKNHEKPDYAWIGNVCDGVRDKDSFKTVAKNDFPSSLRGGISKLIEQPSYLEGGESFVQRYNLVVPNLAEFLLDLYLCDSDGQNEYFLTHGYEHDSLFFFFVKYWDTGELALRAIVQEDVVPQGADAKAVEWSYIQRQSSFYQILKTVHPEKTYVEQKDDPICALSDVDKLRLCILMMNTPRYKKKYSFSAKHENVGPCGVSLLHMNKVGKERQAFTYYCSAHSVDNPSLSVPIHISRNYNNYEVNTYREVNGQKFVELDDSFKNIFFVHELYAKEIQELFVARKSATGGLENDGHASGPEGYNGNSNNIDAAAAVVAVSTFAMYDDSDSDDDGDDGDGDGGGGGDGK